MEEVADWQQSQKSQFGLTPKPSPEEPTSEGENRKSIRPMFKPVEKQYSTKEKNEIIRHLQLAMTKAELMKGMREAMTTKEELDLRYAIQVLKERKKERERYKKINRNMREKLMLKEETRDNAKVKYEDNPLSGQKQRTQKTTPAKTPIREDFLADDIYHQDDNIQFNNPSKTYDESEKSLPDIYPSSKKIETSSPMRETMNAEIMRKKVKDGLNALRDKQKEADKMENNKGKIEALVDIKKRKVEIVKYLNDLGVTDAHERPLNEENDYSLEDLFKYKNLYEDVTQNIDVEETDEKLTKLRSLIDLYENKDKRIQSGEKAVDVREDLRKSFKEYTEKALDYNWDPGVIRQKLNEFLIAKQKTNEGWTKEKETKFNSIKEKFEGRLPDEILEGVELAKAKLEFKNLTGKDLPKNIKYVGQIIKDDEPNKTNKTGGIINALEKYKNSLKK